MATVQVELPAELIAVANLDTANVSLDTARLLALELFREEKISLGRAAELCHTPIAAFMDFAASHGAPPLRYTSEDLEEERRSIERLGA